jgi:hypothetical protein
MGVLVPVLTTFHLYCGRHFYWWRKLEGFAVYHKLPQLTKETFITHNVV